ncbi:MULTISPECIES: phage baseplate assembly protein V [Photorhabdus]|uniref:Gp5/Type VI secretion system Vgr protein OB-fold domain-containing protein n=2 Tax=Photorhabdus asymbiotica TaxID=291112 RepID=B6VL12_PHOAA|nr:phage baseplate assembly protein V [Photorhabdus asymbiotica]RKS65780.1 uncharacterized protein involved in type VI secretion and phage assembly [Photorhabdus asymbiotica]CAQ84333.1 conserved hypothetical protein [Photorhabdus asymbiotica]CAR66842.1 Conserved Hypothetical Protein [Photorhabdus asymbiotica subsp. asymbiotica ATCC 43949]
MSFLDNSNFKPSDIKLFVNIQGVEKELNELIVSELKISRRINAIPQAVVKLRAKESESGVYQSDVQRMLKSCRPGVKAELRILNTRLFSGDIVQQKTELVYAKTHTIKLVLRHDLQRITGNFRTRVFANTRDRKVIADLLNTATLKPAFSGTSHWDIDHEQLVQYRCSDWQFLLQRLYATNSWLLAEEDKDNTQGKVTIIAPNSLPLNERWTLQHQADHQAIRLYSTELMLDNRFDTAEAVVSAWDIDDQALLVAWKETLSQVGKDALASDNFSQTNKDSSELLLSCPLSTKEVQFLTRSQLVMRRLTAVRGSLKVEGSTKYRLGHELMLSGFGENMDGSQILTGVDHRITAEESWKTTLHVGLELPLKAEYVTQVNGVHIGKVADYQSDSKKWDRIPVLIPAFGTNIPLFARLGKPYASHQSGFCFYPETGDEVILSFLEGDPRYPVIIDSLHNPKQQTPLQISKENNLKMLMIKQSDKDEQQLLFDSQQQTVALIGKKNIEVKGEYINLTKSKGTR